MIYLININNLFIFTTLEYVQSFLFLIIKTAVKVNIIYIVIGKENLKKNLIIKHEI